MALWLVPKLLQTPSQAQAYGPGPPDGGSPVGGVAMGTVTLDGLASGALRLETP